jgi:hypothetical protein
MVNNTSLLLAEVLLTELLLLLSAVLVNALLFLFEGWPLLVCTGVLAFTPERVLDDTGLVGGLIVLSGCATRLAANNKQRINKEN